MNSCRRPVHRQRATLLPLLPLLQTCLYERGEEERRDLERGRGEEGKKGISLSYLYLSHLLTTPTSSGRNRYFQREEGPKGTWEQSPRATDFISGCRTRRGRHLAHDVGPRCAGGAGSPSRRELAKVGPLGGVVRQVPIASSAPRDDRGMTTPRESAAMHRMAESLLELLAAIEDGRVQREAERERDRQRAALATTRMHAPQPGKTEPLLVDAKEAARQLGIGIRTLHRLSAPRGPIPTVAIASRVLYAASDLKLIAVQRRLEQDDYGKDSPR